MAQKIYFSSYYDIKKYKIFIPNLNIDTFIRKGYSGGIVDVYKPELINGYHYDINSLYPSVMEKNYYPVSEGYFLKNIENFNDFFGFVDVTVKTPDNLNIPFLTVNSKTQGLITPLGEWRNVYFSEELKYAVKTLNYEIIEIHGSVKYEKKDLIFKKYVNYLYNMRIKHKSGDPMNLICKLLLNSSYGKFGMKHSSNYIEIVDNTKTNDFEHKIRNKKNSQIINFDIINEKTIYEIEEVDVYNKYSGVHVASAITAYARIEIDKYKRMPNIELYYSDTDSIFCQNALKAELVGEKLGLMKLEGLVKHGIFISPKCYYIEYSNEKELLKFKGIQSSNISVEDYISLYKEIPVKKTIKNIFYRNIKSFEIQVKTTNYTFTGKLLKRLKEYSNDVWTNTIPYQINTTNIQNQYKDWVDFIKKFISK